MCEKMRRKLEKSLSDRTPITVVLAVLIVAFGVALIVGGLYFVTEDASVSATSAASVLDWIPGIPFYIGDLADFGVTTIGLVSCALGIGLIIVGLGLWMKRRLARIAAFAIFASAALFQFIQFLLMGIIGSPVSIVEFCVDGGIAYTLMSRFYSKH